jgi:hypothetical protein
MVALLVVAAAREASPHVAAPGYPVERPTLEIASFVGVGGGGRPVGGEARAFFDLRLGYDVTLPVARDGDVRVGPFLELGSATFASFAVVGGLEAFLGGTPRPLRMFYYAGEGTLSVRLGAGWGFWSDLPQTSSSPIASVSVAYGYRAPFSLREPSEQMAATPGHRESARYMTGARLYTNATFGLRAAGIWQVSGGIEFEPVGAVRYLFGLY